jgi:4-aminobutyrate--pyruvate transaminase
MAMLANGRNAAGAAALLLGFSDLRRARDHRPLVITRGRGVFVYDEDGRDYLEASASFYCAALGYSDDRLVAAAHRQLQVLPFYATGLQRTVDNALLLAERLRGLVPIADAHVALNNTGSEANDFALKFLRYANVVRGEPERRKIISRRGSYHGGTIATAALGGGRSLHDAFALPMDDYRFVSQPDGPRAGESDADFTTRLVAELEALLAAEGGETFAAFIAEPISFSCGFFPPPAGYFPRIAAVLRRHGIALIDDEVICGFGRSGALFAAEALGLAPDVLTCGKGMSSGYFPISATILSGEVYRWLEAGSDCHGSFAHATTTSCHPVGVAVALEMLRILEQDGLLAQVRARIPCLHRHLDALADHPLVAGVRKAGFAGGVTLSAARVITARGAPPSAAGLLSRVMGDHGLLVRVTGEHAVIAPPLIITEAELDELFRRLAGALDDVLAALRRDHG